MTTRSATAMTIPQTTLGSTGRTVTILGLGGEGVLRTFGYEREARAMVEAALEAGITYFESARAYSGSEAYLGKRPPGPPGRHFPHQQIPRPHPGRGRGAPGHYPAEPQDRPPGPVAGPRRAHPGGPGGIERAPAGPWRCSGGPKRRAMPASSASPATTTRPYCGRPWTFTTSTRCSCR